MVEVKVEERGRGGFRIWRMVKDSAVRWNVEAGWEWRGQVGKGRRRRPPAGGVMAGCL
jgi:hypothetical protein